MGNNVLRSPLARFGTASTSNPIPVGFMRNGYCQVPNDDAGNHSVAAVVSERFLDFTAERGNNLRTVGLKDGCKWCLCVSRWKEALLAAEKEGDDVVPRVYLNSTSEKALEQVTVDELSKYAVDKRTEPAQEMR